MDGTQKTDGAALLEDESLIQDLAKALLEDMEAADELSEDITDKLEDAIEDDLKPTLS